MHWSRSILLAFAAFVLAVPVTASAESPKRRPNILLIVADDLGYGDLGCFGCTDIPTPHIDSLARDGVRFTSAYAYPTCSPTRASLMTGRYAERFGISKALMGENAPKMEKAVTVAKLLHDAGYVTGLVGKWHLGYSDDVSPTHKGFDEFFGFRGGKIDFFKHTDTAQKDGSPDGKYDLWEGEHLIRRQGYTTDLFTARAKQFIQKHAGGSADKPFFLYLAYNAPHYAKPGLWQAPDAYLKKFNALGQTKGRDVYRAMVACMDDAVGEVLAELDAQHVAGDTLVVFMSDNGPDKPGSAGPLSGGKFTYREGGIRVPWVARLPGVIPPGTVRDDPVHAIDVLPTALAVAGAKPSAKLALDGQNVWPSFTGGPRVRERTLYFSDVGARRGKWKLFEDQLFDVQADPGETTDLAARQPDVRDRLAREVREWATSAGIEPTTKPAGKK
jgi:arylsulfatase A-like enzyme